MKEITLCSGEKTKVDDADYEWLNRYSWHNRGGYANSRITGAGTISMQREIMQPTLEQQVDHIDGDRLNNQRSNLRIITQQQNLLGKKIYKNNTSGFKGVYLVPSTGRWQAKVGFGGKMINCGCFNTPEEAAKAYDEKAKQLHGEFAKLNFPSTLGTNPEPCQA